MNPRGVARVAVAALLLCAFPLQEAQPRERALLADAALPGSLISGIRQAKRSIIGGYYLFRAGKGAQNRPAQIAAELVAAARRGVAVTILLEGKNPVGRHNRKTAILLARGGVKVLFPSGKGATHLKALVIDDRLLFVGSHNLTQGALTKNSELTLRLEDRELALEARRYLERLASHASTLVTGKGEPRE